MPSTFGCFLCGVGIISTPPDSQKWLSEYRAVYRNGANALVTGTGRSDGNQTFKLPKDPSLQWDAVSELHELVEISVLRYSGTIGLHGYVLHAACWTVLSKASEPEGLSTERLLSVCESLPYPLSFNGLNWGHDYGGLFELDLGRSYPWQECFNPIPQAIREKGVSDPLNGPSFNITAELKMPCVSQDVPHHTTSTDFFFRLPWELREMIALNLPTKDALSLRLASRSFRPLFDSLGFWSSRFEPDGERGSLFEVRQGAMIKNAHQLIHLYRISSCSEAMQGFRNRERVWRLARRLALLALPSSPTFKRRVRTSEQGKESRLSGKEQTPSPPDGMKSFRDGCLPITTVDLNVTNAVKIGIAVVNMGLWDYVTGIRIIDSDGIEQSAGYFTNKNEIIVSAAQFHGFRVAMGPGGVRALQIAHARQQTSRWIGRIKGVPCSDRLVTNVPAHSLSITLDGYKVTAIGVNQPCQNRCLCLTASTLRHAALWYPEIPPSELFFNETSFTGQNPLTAKYQPLSWIQFGGIAGEDMSRAEGILVRSSYNIYSLRMVYEKAHTKPYSDVLGCYNENELPETLLPINGSRGEWIDSVDVGVRRDQNARPVLLQHGILECIKITTTHGRTLEIGRQAKDVEMQHVNIAYGTTITGFYGHYDETYGLVSLGIISQQINN